MQGMRSTRLRHLGIVGVGVALAGGAAAIALAVSAPEGTSGSSPSGSGPPEVEKISPRAGSTEGRTEVTITGKNFGPSCRVSVSEPTCPNIIVYFGSEPGFVVSGSSGTSSGSSSTIQVFSPPQAARTVSVAVVTPRGNSASRGENAAARFTYGGASPVPTSGEPPVVSAVEPTHGPSAGFNRVLIKGEHLTPDNKGCVQCSGSSVHFGTQDVVVAQGSQHELLVIAPPHTPGTVNVTVTTNPGATSRISASDDYKYE
jgi:IPT/TIG domain